MRQLSFLVLFPLASGSLAACGDDSGMPPADGGMGDATVVLDGGRPDTGPTAVDVCMAAQAVAGTVGTMTVMGDTAMAATRPRDLGPDCGNAMAPRFAPQEVIAYTVPGTGPVGVRLSLVTSGTSDMFDTVIQVRTACDMIPTDGSVCFDDSDTDGDGELDDVRSAGAFGAEGGSTVYIFVTGYAEADVDAGPWALDITAAPGMPPTLTSVVAGRVGDSLEIVASGMDPDGEVTGFELYFLDAAGAQLSLDMDTTPDPYADAFDTVAAGVGTVRVVGVGELLDDIGAAGIELRLVDDFAFRSDPMMATFGDLGGVGDMCDAAMVCEVQLACTTMMCAASAEAGTACGTATAITIATPTTMTTTAMMSGSIPTTAGALAPSCTVSPQAEVIYTIDVPAGAFDLIARTDLAGSGMTDTVLSLRSACEDPTTEIGCNDDIDLDGGNYRSRLEVRDIPTGEHSLIVEQYGAAMAAGAFALEVGLRPVLAMGATCDMAGVMNRCAGAACAAGTCP